MAVKLAISGKGGVGKTTLAALFCRIFADKGYRVLAIDADPDANLAGALGLPPDKKIVPLVELKDVIEERTGVKPGTSGGFFILNPKVDDIPEKYSVEHNGIRLMLMGTVEGGGSGCACPENTFLKAFLSHLLLERDDAVILDMEAGIEHLGRGTVEGVDGLIIVVEPGRRSIETAFRIKKLSQDLGLKRVFAVANKVRSADDEKFIRERLTSIPVLGVVPYMKEIEEIDRTSAGIFSGVVLDAGRKLLQELESRLTAGVQGT